MSTRLAFKKKKKKNLTQKNTQMEINAYIYFFLPSNYKQTWGGEGG